MIAPSARVARPDLDALADYLECPGLPFDGLRVSWERARRCPLPAEAWHVARSLLALCPEVARERLDALVAGAADLPRLFPAALDWDRHFGLRLALWELARAEESGTEPVGIAGNPRAFEFRAGDLLAARTADGWLEERAGMLLGGVETGVLATLGGHGHFEPVRLTAYQPPVSAGAEAVGILGGGRCDPAFLAAAAEAWAAAWAAVRPGEPAPGLVVWLAADAALRGRSAGMVFAAAAWAIARKRDLECAAFTGDFRAGRFAKVEGIGPKALAAEAAGMRFLYVPQGLNAFRAGSCFPRETVGVAGMDDLVSRLDHEHRQGSGDLAARWAPPRAESLASLERHRDPFPWDRFDQVVPVDVVAGEARADALDWLASSTAHVLLVGHGGAGKTSLLASAGLAAVSGGRTVYFLEAGTWIAPATGLALVAWWRRASRDLAWLVVDGLDEGGYRDEDRSWLPALLADLAASSAPGSRVILSSRPDRWRGGESLQLQAAVRRSYDQADVACRLPGDAPEGCTTPLAYQCFKFLEATRFAAASLPLGALLAGVEGLLWDREGARRGSAGDTTDWRRHVGDLALGMVTADRHELGLADLPAQVKHSRAFWQLPFFKAGAGGLAFAAPLLRDHFASVELERRAAEGRHLPDVSPLSWADALGLLADRRPPARRGALADLLVAAALHFQRRREPRRRDAVVALLRTWAGKLDAAQLATMSLWDAKGAYYGGRYGEMADLLLEAGRLRDLESFPAVAAQIAQQFGSALLDLNELHAARTLLDLAQRLIPDHEGVLASEIAGTAGRLALKEGQVAGAIDSFAAKLRAHAAADLADQVCRDRNDLVLALAVALRLAPPGERRIAEDGLREAFGKALASHEELQAAGYGDQALNVSYLYRNLACALPAVAESLRFGVWVATTVEGGLAFLDRHGLADQPEAAFIGLQLGAHLAAAGRADRGASLLANAHAALARDHFRLEAACAAYLLQDLGRPVDPLAHVADMRAQRDRVFAAAERWLAGDLEADPRFWESPWATGKRPEAGWSAAFRKLILFE
ncbi:MAG: hypothetical protein FJZ01_01975 [Candidatus Sericytochromatia bacterium]|nr:hypothetical protein [Candidatus Tanganyikabacteria bacterium]